MNKVLQFPMTRMIVVIPFIGSGIAAGWSDLSFLRSIFSITNTGLASLLTFDISVVLLLFTREKFSYKAK